ncbi:putative cytokinetic ring protein SteA [Brevibacillus sp. SAFN-007a]|uniref:putative cytokinetic ring protein SteA n=1 Tax=Brevibacillus sp. SAFN-007a TaxID=3436862 RepID=UPI003F7F0922
MGKRKRLDFLPYTGVIAADRKTKQLCKRLHPHHIAVIDHPDVDEMAARSLLEAGARVVVNLSAFMTGQYPAEGARLLLHAGVTLYEAEDEPAEPTGLDAWDGQFAAVREGSLYVKRESQWEPALSLRRVTIEAVLGKWAEAQSRLDDTLSLFIDNTLMYAKKEKDLFLKPLCPLPLRTRLEKRHVVVVVRGKHYKEDLQTLSSYIRECQPVLVGVDGGADALLQAGYKPDLIVGDMDSISDKALLCGAEIVVHAFVDGLAPGKARVEQLGVAHHVLPAPGTSEDVAMLLAYEKKAELIVTIGAHTNMIDFLEKGRKGMASTLLVRTKIGPRLIDAKGVSQLYQPTGSWKLWGWCAAAMLLPVTAALMIHPIARHAAQMLWTQWRTWAF